MDTKRTYCNAYFRLGKVRLGKVRLGKVMLSTAYKSSYGLSNAVFEPPPGARYIFSLKIENKVVYRGLGDQNIILSK